MITEFVEKVVGTEIY